jgi:transposase
VRERYASDLSDTEFGLIKPLLPVLKKRGRKPVDARIISNALLDLIRCAICARSSRLIARNRTYVWRDSGLSGQIV